MANGADGLENLTTEQLQQIAAQEGAAAPSDGLENLSIGELQALAAEEGAVDPGPTIGESIQTGVEQFGRQAAFGFTPEIGAAIEPFVPDPRSSINERLRQQGFKVEEFDPSFDERVAAEERRLEAQAERSPVASAIGSIGGLVSGGALGARAIGAAARGIAGPTLTRAARTIATPGEKASLLQKATGLGTRAGLVGAEGAALTAAQKGTTLEDVQTGGLISGAFPVLGAAARGAKALARGTFATTFGVRSKAVSDMLDSAQDIRNLDDPVLIEERARDAVQRLKSTEQALGEEASADVIRALNGMKQRSIDLSRQGFDILEKSGKTVKKDEVLRALQRPVKELSGRLGQSAKDASARLKSFADEVNAGVQADSAGNLTPVQVKKVLQDLQENIGDLSASRAAGTKASRGEVALIKAAGELNKTLRKVGGEEYQSLMRESSALTNFVKKAAKDFGTEDKALSAVRRIGKPGETFKDQRLKKLIKEHGTFDIQRYKEVKAQSDLVKSWNDSNFNNKFESMLRGIRNDERTALEGLKLVSDDQFVRQIELTALNREFEKEFFRGSHNVNLWAFIGLGSLGGGLVSQDGGLMGGAAVGALMNRFGPRAARQILIEIARIRGVVTVPKIMRMNLPESAKKDLAESFRRTIVRSSVTPEPVHVPEESRAQLRFDIERSEVLTNIEKAKAINGINSTGDVNSTTMLKLADGTRTPPPRVPSFKPRKPKQDGRSISDVSEVVKHKREPEY